MSESACFPKPAVSAIIVNEGRILLVKRACEPSKGLWSLPGGAVEPGETVRQALIREVAEETGLAVEPTGIAGVRDVIIRDNGGILLHYVIISFHVKVLSGTPIAASDAAELRWVPLDELSRYKTTAGLLDWLTEIGVWSPGAARFPR